MGIPYNYSISTISAAIAGRDILASSATGTEKTTAYLLTVIQYLFNYPDNRSGQLYIFILVLI